MLGGSILDLPDATTPHALLFLQIPGRPLTILITEHDVENRSHRVLSALDVPLAHNEAVVSSDCLLDGAYIPISHLLTLVPDGQRGHVAAIRAWAFDAGSQSFVELDAGRVTCTFSRL